MKDDGRILAGKRILLVIGGGIAAYKSLDLIRRLRERGAAVRGVMTAAAKQFITPMAVASLTGEPVHDDLFSAASEGVMGHIELSRDADLLVVAPATAGLLAKMAHGLADDLASTVLLATDKRALVAPAMNLRMWLHASTRRNMEQIRRDGVLVVGPDDGAMACGEYGPGRMAEPLDIVAAAAAALAAGATIPLPPEVLALSARRALEGKPLAGARVVITSGPTHEPLDPVRYLGNRSSGRQGHALAEAAAAAGATVALVSGPVALPDPPGVAVTKVETARQMRAAVEAALPADIFIAAAAVADWRPRSEAGDKLKKGNAAAPRIDLEENPDILAGVAALGARRPRLVVGFAAETRDVIGYATEKRARKGCDMIVANDVSSGTGTFGGGSNQVHIVTASGVESWPRMSKADVARRLVGLLAASLRQPEAQTETSS